MWLDAVRYVLLLWGVIYLVTSSVIFRPFRIALSRHLTIAMLLYCPSCFGTWVGFALYKLLPWDSSVAWLESGLVAMALGRVWSRLFGDNTAWEAEYPLIAERLGIVPEGNEDVGGDTDDAGD